MTDWKRVRDELCFRHCCNDQTDVYDDAEKAYKAAWSDAIANDPRLKALVEALEKIVIKVPEKVPREEAADMACEFKIVASQALKAFEGSGG